MWAWTGWSRLLEGKEGSLCRSVACGEVGDVCGSTDESVFCYCVSSAGALCPPKAEDESDGNETGQPRMNFFPV